MSTPRYNSIGENTGAIFTLGKDGMLCVYGVCVCEYMLGVCGVCECDVCMGCVYVMCACHLCMKCVYGTNVNLRVRQES